MEKDKPLIKYKVNELLLFIKQNNITVPLIGSGKNKRVLRKDLLTAIYGNVSIGEKPIKSYWVDIEDWANAKLLQEEIRPGWYRYESFKLEPIIYKLPTFIESISLGNKGERLYYNKNVVSNKDIKTIKARSSSKISQDEIDLAFGRVLGYIYPIPLSKQTQLFDILLGVHYVVEDVNDNTYPIYSEIVPNTIDFNLVVEKYLKITKTLKQNEYTIKLEIIAKKKL